MIINGLFIYDTPEELLKVCSEQELNDFKKLDNGDDDEKSVALSIQDDSINRLTIK